MKYTSLFFYNIITRHLSTKRPEAQMLRAHLLRKYEKHALGCHCSMCLAQLPLHLLEAAHLKPRCTMCHDDLRNIHNVEFMCRVCHHLYDAGIYGVNRSGVIDVASNVKNLHLRGAPYIHYGPHNSPFFEWHYGAVFLSSKPQKK
jgi:predicted restriction endonuclease